MRRVEGWLAQGKRRHATPAAAHQVVEEDEAPCSVSFADVTPLARDTVERDAVARDRERADARRQCADGPENRDQDDCYFAAWRPHGYEDKKGVDRERERRKAGREVGELAVERVEQGLQSDGFSPLVPSADVPGSARPEPDRPASRRCGLRPSSGSPWRRLTRGYRRRRVLRRGRGQARFAGNAEGQRRPGLTGSTSDRSNTASR